METAAALGRVAATIKLAAGAAAPAGPGTGMDLGATPSGGPRAPAAMPPRAPGLPRPAPALSPAPAPAPAPPAPAGTGAGGLLGQARNWLRDPRGLAQLIGAGGGLSKGLLGMTGAPGLFALSNFARNGGQELGSILRGPITPPREPTGPPTALTA